MKATWRRQDVALAGEALALLVAARVALWLLPFATAHRMLGRWARPRGGRAQTAERVAWALAAAARRLPSPFRACLPQALAAEALLQRHGAPAALIIGVRPDPIHRPSPPSIAFHRPPLQAHAWVESDERVVVGWLDDLASYARMVTITR